MAWLSAANPDSRSYSAGWLWALFEAGAPAPVELAADELAADELPAGASAAGAPPVLPELEFGFDLLHPPNRKQDANREPSDSCASSHFAPQFAERNELRRVWIAALAYSNSGQKLSQRFAEAFPLAAFVRLR
jgi:hypothetical protein